MLRREIPMWLQLADRQLTESCSWHVVPETATRHHDPYRSRHRSLGRARFLRDESLCRFYALRRRCCFRSTPSLLKPVAPRLRPLPPGWPRFLITIGSGSSSISNCRFQIADCEEKHDTLPAYQDRTCCHSKRSEEPRAG